MAKTVFDIIKKQNGERFAKTIRNYDDGIFDVRNIDKIVEFAGRDAEPLLPYLQSLKQISIDAADVSLSPFELLDQAGYHAEYADTLEKQNAIACYFQYGERLCTFRDDSRYKKYHIINAVRNDVDEIKRADFTAPAREDKYGTSVMSIQILKAGGFISIKNRYNHSVPNPDNTLSSNPDNIIYGLSASLKQYFNVDFSSRTIGVPDGYVLIAGNILKFNYEFNNMYFGETFFARNRDITKLNPDYEIMLDEFIFNTKTREIVNPADADDGFINAFLAEIKNKKVRIEKTPAGRRINIDGGGCVATEKGKIIELALPTVTEIGDAFLFHNNSICEISLPNVKTVGKNFLRGCYRRAKLTRDYNVARALVGPDYEEDIRDFRPELLIEHPDLYTLYLENHPEFRIVPQEYWTPELAARYDQIHIGPETTKIILQKWPELLDGFLEKGFYLNGLPHGWTVNYHMAKLTLKWHKNIKDIPHGLLDKHPDLWKTYIKNGGNITIVPHNEFTDSPEFIAALPTGPKTMLWIGPESLTRHPEHYGIFAKYMYEGGHEYWLGEVLKTNFSRHNDFTPHDHLILGHGYGEKENDPKNLAARGKNLEFLSGLVNNAQEIEHLNYLFRGYDRVSSYGLCPLTIFHNALLDDYPELYPVMRDKYMDMIDARADAAQGERDGMDCFCDAISHIPECFTAPAKFWQDWLDTARREKAEADKTQIYSGHKTDFRLIPDVERIMPELQDTAMAKKIISHAGVMPKFYALDIVKKYPGNLDIMKTYLMSGGNFERGEKEKILSAFTPEQIAELVPLYSGRISDMLNVMPLRAKGSRIIYDAVSRVDFRTALKWFSKKILRLESIPNLYAQPQGGLLKILKKIPASARDADAYDYVIKNMKRFYSIGLAAMIDDAPEKYANQIIRAAIKNNYIAPHKRLKYDTSEILSDPGVSKEIIEENLKTGPLWPGEIKELADIFPKSKRIAVAAELNLRSTPKFAMSLVAEGVPRLGAMIAEKLTAAKQKLLKKTKKNGKPPIIRADAKQR